VTVARLADAGQHGEQRAFTGAIRADYAEKLSGADIERDTAYDVDIACAKFQVMSG